MFRILALALVLFAGAASAQSLGDPHPLEPLEMSSPRAAIRSFIEGGFEAERLYLDYKEDKTLDGAKALFAAMRRLDNAFDLTATPPALQREVGSESSVFLIDILLRLPRIDPAEIPGGDVASSDLPASWTVPNTEITLVRIEDGPRAGEYLFSADTVARLAEFHERIISYPVIWDSQFDNWGEELMAWTGPLFPERRLESLPGSLTRPVLGTLVWKIALTGALWVGIGIVVMGWAGFLRRFDRNPYSVGALLRRTTLPLLLICLVWSAHRFAIYQTGLTGMFSEIELIATTIVTYVALAWAVLLALFLIVEMVIASPAIPEDSYDAHLLRLVARVGGVFAAAAVLLYGGSQIGIPALGLLAGVGFGGIALALAGQHIVEDLIGGFSIFLDRPFRVGDFIGYGTGMGTVEGIGPRSARLRGLDGTLSTVPNTDLSKAHVTNFSVRKKCLFLQNIGLRYETSRAQIEWILARIRTHLVEHPLVEQGGGLPRVRLMGFGASSIDIEVRAYVLTSDFGYFLELQEALLLDIQDIIEEGGSSFAFPSQTIYIGRDSGLDPDAADRIARAPLNRSVPA